MWPAATFDRFYSERQQARLEHFIVRVSALGFLGHLVLVFLARNFGQSNAALAMVGHNYLSAIYTPFSVILFYEALMLIAALPQSTTQSIAKQFEIVSLIFIRKFFKDIAQLDDIGKMPRLSQEVMPVFMDVAAGLLMFLLVTIFLHAARNRPQRNGPAPESSPELRKFIARKKMIALALTATLLIQAALHLFEFIGSDYRNAYLGVNTTSDHNSFLYTDLFALMIFSDVLIVILSVVVSDSYEMVFRNAAFVISTILLRFSLTAERPYGAILAISGMVFGILTLLIYNYHTRIRQTNH